jgi:hypothetical protein
VLEAIDFLRVIPRVDCWGCGVPMMKRRQEYRAEVPQ